MKYPSLNINETHATLKEGVELTIAIAEEIRTFDGSLTIRDTYDLPSDFLKTLLDGFKGTYLSLLGMTQLSAETAEALSKFPGGLNLNDVEEISAEAAAHLATHQGELDLNGLLSITEDAGMQLSKHSKPLLLENLDTVAIPPSVLSAFKQSWPAEWENA